MVAEERLPVDVPGAPFCAGCNAWARARARRRRSQKRRSTAAMAVASTAETITPASADVGIRETRREGVPLVAFGTSGFRGDEMDDVEGRELVLGLSAEECEVTGEPDTLISTAEVEVVTAVEVKALTGVILRAVTGRSGVSAVCAWLGLAKGDVFVGDAAFDSDRAFPVLAEEVDRGMGKVVLPVLVGESTGNVMSDGLNRGLVSPVVSCTVVAEATAPLALV